jgi:hypothetical protein
MIAVLTAKIFFDGRLTKIGSDGCLQVDYASEFRAMLVGVVL